MKYCKLPVLFALFIATGCSNENSVSEQDAKMLPFTGTYSGRSVVAPSAHLAGFQRCSDERLLCLEGSGQFTQLGGATVVHAHCTHADPISSDPLTLEVLYGKIAVIGANGDEVYIDYEGSIIYSEKVVLKGEFSISGGAGRFSDADGNGTFVCEMTGPDNAFVSELKGEISSPYASGK